nr:hypothetical transcript [Hymenolepis microstoma]
MNNKYKQFEEISLDKTVSLAKGKKSNLVAQNTGQTSALCLKDLMCSQTNATSSHIDLSPERSIRGISNPFLTVSYSKWPEVLFIKYVTISFVINNLRQVFTNHGLPKVGASRNAIKFSSTRFEVCCHNPTNVLALTSLNFND